MKRVFPLLLLAGLIVLGVSGLALADYVDPPDWSANPYYTHQSWDFNETGWTGNPPEPIPPVIPLVPDGEVPMVNPYQGPSCSTELIGTDSEPPGGVWQWTDVPMGGPWTRSGMYGGMESGWVEFMICNADQPDRIKEMWIQYVVYLPTAYNPATNTTTTVTGCDSERATMISKEFVQTTGGGGTGYWWIVTELWEVDPQPACEIVRIFADNGTGAACLFDQVDIDTRCILPDPLEITTPSLAGGTVGTPYSQTLQAQGGTPPFSWAITAGSLPSGLSLNSSTGEISGTPTSEETLVFTVEVTDAAMNTDSKQLSIAVTAGGCFVGTALNE